MGVDFMMMNSCMEKIIQFLDTYQGRDRVLRLLCYSSKCLAGLVNSEELGLQLDRFSKNISASRTCFRLLDDIPTIAGVTNNILKEKEKESAFEKFVSLLENVVELLFCPFDHISWAIDCKIVNSNSDIWDSAGTVCWILSLYLSIYRILVKLAAMAKQKSVLKIEDSETRKKLIGQQLRLKLSASKCLFDILFAVNYLPSGTLWGGCLKKWQVGALGTISSLVSLYLALML